MKRYEVETPRGGRHLYFIGSLPPSTSQLGDHVDTRGERQARDLDKRED